MALPNCPQRCSPERRTGPQIRMKISPALARKSNSPASRYFPRNFNTRCDAAPALREFQRRSKEFNRQTRERLPEETGKFWRLLAYLAVVKSYPGAD